MGVGFGREWSWWFMVCSLQGFNLALLQKWRCRFVKNPNALCMRVISAIHGKGAELLLALSLVTLVGPGLKLSNQPNFFMKMRLFLLIF